MAEWRVEGGRPLQGEVAVSPSKNAVLPLMAAALLTEHPLVLTQVPNLLDVEMMQRLLQSLGARTMPRGEGYEIRCQRIDGLARQDTMRAMRASILTMGPLLARRGYARAALPGGCAIGLRPIDQHIKGFEAMGAAIELYGGWVEARGTLCGADIELDMPSVGATENLLMAATLAHGTTRIRNAAREPEIDDLAQCLRSMGARIRGEGTPELVIEGVAQLGGATHTPIPDRIEVGTLLCAAIATRGNVLVRGGNARHLGAVLHKLRECGAQLREVPGGLWVRGPITRAISVVTDGYPGFPTDLQAPLMAMLLGAPGVSTIRENVFENRYMHVGELTRMGARIHVDGRNASIHPSELCGVRVRATDLRAGAALVVAALGARGVSIIEDTWHIQRGYDGFVEKLRALGAHIQESDGALAVRSL